MRTNSAILVVAPLSLLMFGCTVAAPPADASGRADDVVRHLEQAIAWYRSMGAAERSEALADDVVERDAARRMSTQALQLAFTFARAEAALLGPEQTSAPAAAQTGSGRNMDQVAARAKQRVAGLEQQLAALDIAAAKAPRSARPLIEARRQQLADELDLAKQLQKSVNDMAAFIGSVGAGNTGLASRVDELERSVPEIMRAANQPPPPGAAAATTTPFHAESAGIFALSSELVTMVRARHQLKHLIEDTDALLKSANSLRTPLSDEFRAAIRRSDAIGAESASDTKAEDLANRHKEIEALAARVKQLSAAVVPLREESVLIEASRGNLAEWQNSLEARFNTVGGYLLMRSVVLAIVICILLVISEFWRRMTFRYAKDARRRRQFLVLRRVVVGSAIALVVILGFVSEVGSLATYAGFLTAGLAVALQNPILSVVAYFFLIGRYGLRVGDRVTISGVTGDVIEIGLVRMYIMELEGKDADLRPTGRVVAFANAVLFQPAALFKRMPGADYVWRTASVTLAGECDARAAETKLMAAVSAVYEEYREKIEEQHALFERSVDMKVAPPAPQGHIRMTDSGLEFSVRYPVELRRGPAIDERILRALHETVANDPALALARQGEPRLQEAR
jgi:small-conductance mechanosensitive channel